jgi:hypothetical protein
VPRTGRPSAYRPEFVEQVYKLALLGATDAQMADILGVTEQVIYDWDKKHPDFRQSRTRGKDAADANVAERLYKRAMGYEHEAVKIMQYEGEPVLVPYTEHYPPDTQAASWWLKNRHPDKWKDKHEHDISGTLVIQPVRFAEAALPVDAEAVRIETRPTE